MPKILNYFQCFSFCKKKNNKKPLFSCLDVKGVRPILNRSDAPNLEQDSVILDNSDIAQSLDVAEIHVPRAVSPSNEEECLHISDKNAENNISSFSRNASLEGEVFGQVNLDKRFHLDGDLQGNKFLRLYYNPGTTEASSNVNEIIQRRLEEFKRLKNISPVHTLENIDNQWKLCSLPTFTKEEKKARFFKYAFVITEIEGKVKIILGTSNHYFLTKKEFVYLAGDIYFKDGEIVKISNQSGGYHSVLSDFNKNNLKKYIESHLILLQKAGIESPEEVYEPTGVSPEELNVVVSSFKRKKSHINLFPGSSVLNQFQSIAVTQDGKEAVGLSNVIKPIPVRSHKAC